MWGGNRSWISSRVHHQRDRQVHPVPDRRHARPRRGRDHDHQPGRPRDGPEPDLAGHQQPAHAPGDRRRHAPVGRLPGARQAAVLARDRGAQRHRRPDAPLPGIGAHASPASPTRPRAPEPCRTRASPSSARSRSTAASCPETCSIHLESTTVIDRLTMPDTFTLVFRDPDRNILSTAGIQVGDQGRDLDHLDARGRPEGSHRRRGHLDRDRVRLARHAGCGPRLRPLAPPCRGPQVEDVPEREVLGHRNPAGERLGAHAGRRRVRGHPRPRVPGEPVRPRLPVRPRPPDRLRLPRRRREPAVQAGRSSPPPGRPRARPWAPIRQPSCGATTCWTSGPG